MNKRYRGIFFLDALFGILIAVTVTTAVVVVASDQNRVADRLAQSRSDVRSLESALIRLQSSQPPLDGVQISPIDGVSAPAGWRWVQATTGDGVRRAILRGLVPIPGDTK